MKCLEGRPLRGTPFLVGCVTIVQRSPK
jgi:hypothetical protein